MQPARQLFIVHKLWFGYLTYIASCFRIAVDLENLLFNKKQVEFAMKALLSLATHIWYYKVIVTIFLKKGLFAWKGTVTIIIWKIAWLAWKGMLLHIDLSGTCVPRIWHVWNKSLCFNSICLFALTELHLYIIFIPVARWRVYVCCCLNLRVVVVLALQRWILAA